jgi:hypothetical protein
METANILTEQEARDSLRLDGDSQYSEFEANNVSATAYIDNATGAKWESKAPIDPIAKACARLYVQQDFYHDKDHDFKDQIQEYLCILLAKARGTAT